MSCFWNLEISWGSCEAEGVRDWLRRVLGIVVRKMLVSAETARDAEGHRDRVPSCHLAPK